MWLIAGLGNPGRKYQRTRHNIGFRVADELARRHLQGPFRQSMGGELNTGALHIGGRPHKAIVFKPLQFMNVSGFPIQRVVHYYDIEMPNLLVIHDEIDIEFGRLKLKSGGGHGGHNGLRSIIKELGGKDFLRVRVGVGKPGPPGQADAGAAGADRPPEQRTRRVVGHVLSEFPAAMEPEVAQLVSRAADAAEAIISDGIRAAMNAFHHKPRPPEPAAE